MRIARFLGIVGLVLPAIMSSAHAEGDAAAGRALAEEWCVRCHNIEPGGPFKLYPPSFASISAYRPADGIRAWITYPPMHGGMPQVGFMLTPENIDDLVAYIVSLETK
jgi:mono/diheme cytochrome c family protein